MHLARINTSIELDLSSPLIALVFSRVLLSLEARISDIRKSVKGLSPSIIDETHSQSAVSWRTDRGVQIEESILENKGAYDAITRWVEDQQYISTGECVLDHPYYNLTDIQTATWPTNPRIGIDSATACFYLCIA